jgi:hypothetical protein
MAVVGLDQKQQQTTGTGEQPAERARKYWWLTEAQAVLGWGVIMILAALLGAIYLNQASRIASIGRRVQQLQFEVNELKRVNATLERQIAQGQSLERLDEAAVRLGFVRARPEDIEYLIVPNYPVQSDLAAPVEATEPPAPIETIEEALWLALKSSVGDLIRGESP